MQMHAESALSLTCLRFMQGAPKGDEKPDLTLTISDANFAQLVMGKLNPQTVNPVKHRVDRSCVHDPTSQHAELSCEQQQSVDRLGMSV